MSEELKYLMVESDPGDQPSFSDAEDDKPGFSDDDTESLGDDEGGISPDAA